jgi:hypothetical protein
MAVDYSKLRSKYKQDADRVLNGPSNSGNNSKRAIDTSGYDVTFWEPSPDDGSKLIDIVPYIAQTSLPSTKYVPGVEANSPEYKLDYWVHTYVGPNKDAVLCRSKMGLGKCPICDMYWEGFNNKKEALMETGMNSKDANRKAAEEFKSLKPKHRVLYNIIDLDAGDDKIKVFDTSHFWSEEPIIAADDLKRTRQPDYPNFFAHDNGVSLLFSVSLGSFMNNEFTKIEFSSLEPRTKQYDDSILDKTYPLDKFLVIPTEEDVLNALHGVVEPTVTEPAKAEPEQPKTVAPEKSAEALKRERMAKMQAQKAPATGSKCPVADGTFGEDYCAFDECLKCSLATECAENS